MTGNETKGGENFPQRNGKEERIRKALKDKVVRFAETNSEAEFNEEIEVVNLIQNNGKNIKSARTK